MPKQFVKTKQVVIGVYLLLGAFLLAHTVNAFVADALRPPSTQVSEIAPIDPSETQAPSPRNLADAIVAGGLFPLHLAGIILLPHVRRLNRPLPRSMSRKRCR